MSTLPPPDDLPTLQARLAELQTQMAALERRPQDLATKLQLRALRREAAPLQARVAAQEAAHLASLPQPEADWAQNAKGWVTAHQRPTLRAHAWANIAVVCILLIGMGGLVVLREGIAAAYFFCLVPGVLWVALVRLFAQDLGARPGLTYHKGKLGKLGPGWFAPRGSNLMLGDRLLYAPRELFNQLQSGRWYEVYYTRGLRQIVSLRPLGPEKPPR